MMRSTRVIVEALGWRHGEDQLELERELIGMKCEGSHCDKDAVGTMRRETLDGRQVVGRTEFYCERHLGDATSVSTFGEEGEELPFSEGPDGDGRQWIDSAADRPPAATRYE